MLVGRGAKSAGQDGGGSLGAHVLVSLADVLVWPIVLEPGAFAGGERGTAESSGRIPFDALFYAQHQYGIDLTSAVLVFADRAQDYLAYVARRKSRKRGA